MVTDDCSLPIKQEIDRLFPSGYRKARLIAWFKGLMISITANDLKTRGIASLEQGLKDDLEVTITVRGKERFVVMRIEQYHHFREMELEAALAETKKDIEAGAFVKESVADHIARLESE